MSIQNNFMKKMFSLALAMIVSLSFFALAITEVSACTEETQSKIYYNKKLYDSNSEVCDKICKGMADMEEQIYIGDYKITREQTKYLMKTVIRKHPELYYVDSTKYMSGTDGDYVMVVCPFYLYDSKTFDD